MGIGGGMKIEPFAVNIPQQDVDDLYQRLRQSRFLKTLAGTGWSYGTNSDYMRELLAYWLDKYDWPAAQRRLNQWPQFTAEIDGSRLHFIHARSAHADAMPLLITHGWPGSIHEFHKIIGPLIAPERHGGDARDAFHVICPSLTGYGWSDPFVTPGGNIGQVAERQVKLLQGLGYPRYALQGGDWGSIAGSHMALLDPEKVIGLHLNLCVAPSTDDPAEAAAQGVIPGPLALTTRYAIEENGYAMIQGKKPDQLGYALNDSPLGLAAWIVGCFEMWGDVNGDLESRFDKDFLITNILIYWFTQSMPTAIRLYRESMAAGQFGPPPAYVSAPTAVALFKDVAMPKRAWAERCYNIQRWTEFKQGGHFAAVEQPAELVADIREFFRALR